MKAGIVFFSRSNNTRAGAEYLATQLGGKLIELVETRARKGLFGFIKSGYQAVSGNKSVIEGTPWKNIEALTNIYLMTPIWGGNITPAMNTFLNEANFQEKEVTVITFQADIKGNGSDKVADYVKNLVEQGGGKYLRNFALHSAAPGKFAGKDYIQNQVDKIL